MAQVLRLATCLMVLTACGGPSDLVDPDDSTVRVRARNASAGTTSHSLGGGGTMLQYTLEWQAAGQERRARLDVPGSAGELSGGELSALSSAGDQQRVAVRRSAGGSWTLIFLMSSGRPGIVQVYSDQSREVFDWSDAPTLNALADDILERGDEALGRRALSRRRGQLSEGARAILREAGRPIPERAERDAGE